MTSNISDARYVLATANPGKIREMRAILGSFGIKTLTREELGINIDIDETGATFYDNAALKARAICEVSGLPSIADDSGLVVEALGGAPGVHTSSYGGEELSDIERCAWLLKKMENMEQRSAKFVCTIVCLFPNGAITTAEGECHGEIALSPRGADGFGFDPVFFITDRGKTLAELPPDEKNALSHRGAALRALAKQLETGRQA